MYTITFDDGTIFQGGSPDSSQWNNMPAGKLITQLEYVINGQSLLMSNYISYNHLVEKVNIGGQDRITKLMVLGEGLNKQVDVFTMPLNIAKKTFVKSTVDYGHEYNGKATTGWKPGKSTDTPNSRITNINPLQSSLTTN